jgi:hypothetical protein
VSALPPRRLHISWARKLLQSLLEKRWEIWLAALQVSSSKRHQPRLRRRWARSLLAKASLGSFPSLGPVIGASINAYFIKDIADSANTYYQRKRELLG